ncbi:MAG: hypothetical protein ACREOZ_05120, partial [Gloeomargaritales cyanobacterium]
YAVATEKWKNAPPAPDPRKLGPLRNFSFVAPSKKVKALTSGTAAQSVVAPDTVLLSIPLEMLNYRAMLGLMSAFKSALKLPVDGTEVLTEEDLIGFKLLHLRAADKQIGKLILQRKGEVLAANLLAKVRNQPLETVSPLSVEYLNQMPAENHENMLHSAEKENLPATPCNDKGLAMRRNTVPLQDVAIKANRFTGERFHVYRRTFQTLQVRYGSLHITRRNFLHEK